MDLIPRHGSDHGMSMSMPSNATHEPPPPSYFYHTESTGLLYAHVSLSILAWCFALPVAVFLSIGRTRWTLPAHVVFSALNIGAMLFGVWYNASTPDLYENNVHHKLGWIFSLVAAGHSLMALVRAFAPKSTGRSQQPEDFKFPSVGYKPAHGYDWSQDSGVGSSDGESPRHSLPGSPGFEDAPPATTTYAAEPEEFHDEEQEDDQEHEGKGLLGSTAFGTRLHDSIRPYVQAVASSRAMRVIGWVYEALDRTILMLAFVLVTTGIVTYGGLFKGIAIFSGLAHFIKGGIFFWYGLLTLGRVMGSCADLGWAWNMKPTIDMVGKRRANAPSLEFIESFLIFFYGSTNVFLEHLGSTDGSWSAQDLEHVSIAVLFLGAGLAGLLIESRKMRGILNSTITAATSQHGFVAHAKDFAEPESYGYSLNPMPGLTIMLLGIMMSSHHQESMVSTMLHGQWGMLFVATAFARGVTYLLIYLNPPTSYLPSRPPTEIVTAFCLISGGLIFMSSNSDMVEGMENLGLNAMVVFTMLMGLTAFIMAWEIAVLGIKGLAVQGEMRRSGRTLSSASTQA